MSYPAHARSGWNLGGQYTSVRRDGEMGSIRDEALTDKDLLAQVVKHKEMFYPSG